MVRPTAIVLWLAVSRFESLCTQMTYRPVLHVHSGWKLHNQIKKLECHLRSEWQPSSHARHEHGMGSYFQRKKYFPVYTVVNRVSQENPSIWEQPRKSQDFDARNSA
jgi:hypothetical protein